MGEVESVTRSGGIESTHGRGNLMRSKVWIPLVASVALCACSIPANYAGAKISSNAFHLLMDRGEYAAIYDSATPNFRAALPRDQLIAFLTRVNRKVGTCGEAPTSVLGYQVTTSGTLITTTSSRPCAQGVLNEQFLWLIVEGRAVLVRYNANSPLLLTD